MTYDSRLDTMEHIGKVRFALQSIQAELALRSLAHDKSKLQEPEKSLYDEWSPKLHQLEYGSDEYKAALEEMGPALLHHYQANRHHPEHFSDGITDMSLIDIIEMLCDWRAANQQYGGDFSEAIKKSCQRFGIERQLGVILANTAKDLEWIDHR